MITNIISTTGSACGYTSSGDYERLAKYFTISSLPRVLLRGSKNKRKGVCQFYAMVLVRYNDGSLQNFKGASFDGFVLNILRVTHIQKFYHEIQYLKKATWFYERGFIICQLQCVNPVNLRRHRKSLSKYSIGFTFPRKSQVICF